MVVLVALGGGRGEEGRRGGGEGGEGGSRLTQYQYNVVGISSNHLPYTVLLFGFYVFFTIYYVIIIIFIIRFSNQ